jgi:hypothetical protein
LSQLKKTYIKLFAKPETEIHRYSLWTNSVILVLWPSIGEIKVSYNSPPIETECRSLMKVGGNLIFILKERLVQSQIQANLLRTGPRIPFKIPQTFVNKSQKSDSTACQQDSCTT